MNNQYIMGKFKGRAIPKFVSADNLALAYFCFAIDGCCDGSGRATDSPLWVKCKGETRVQARLADFDNVKSSEYRKNKTVSFKSASIAQKSGVRKLMS